MNDGPDVCALCGKEFTIADTPSGASDGNLVHEECEERYEDVVFWSEFDDFNDSL